MRLNDGHDIFEPGLRPGALLLAHPSLLDPNFERSVVLLTVHGETEGSLGVIVNRPLGKTLGEHDSELSGSFWRGSLYMRAAQSPSDKMILAAWKWVPESGSFKLFFGIDGDKASRILAEDSGFHVLGFMGHSGWSEGQLQEEMAQGLGFSLRVSRNWRKMTLAVCGAVFFAWRIQRCVS